MFIIGHTIVYRSMLMSGYNKHPSRTAPASVRLSSLIFLRFQYSSIPPLVFYKFEFDS